MIHVFSIYCITMLYVLLKSCLSQMILISTYNIHFCAEVWVIMPWDPCYFLDETMMLYKWTILTWPEFAHMDSVLQILRKKAIFHSEQTNQSFRMCTQGWLWLSKAVCKVFVNFHIKASLTIADTDWSNCVDE